MRHLVIVRELTDRFNESSGAVPEIQSPGEPGGGEERPIKSASSFQSPGDTGSGTLAWANVRYGFQLCQ